MALRSSSEGRSPLAIRRAQVDRAVDVTSNVHSQKVAALLNSQNRLLCENAALKREDLAHRQAQQGRGQALARAEKELLQQDAMIRALYSFLGKEVARPQILRALEAGPKRLRATTREELRWQIDDAREEMLKARKGRDELKASKQSTADSEAGNQFPAGNKDREKINDVKRQIAEMKLRISELEEEHATHKVEISSLERALERGLERLDAPRPSASAAPWKVLDGSRGTGPIAPDLKDRSRLKDEEIRDLIQTRLLLDQDLVKRERQVLDLQHALDKILHELEVAQRARDNVQRQMGVVFQSEIISERKKMKLRERDLDKVQTQLKAMRADQKGMQLDSQLALSVCRKDLLRQSEASEREFKLVTEEEEKKLSVENETTLEEIKKTELALEVDYEACCKERSDILKEARAFHQEADETVAKLRRIAESEAKEESALLREQDKAQEVLAEKVRLQDEKRDLEIELDEISQKLNEDRWRDKQRVRSKPVDMLQEVNTGSLDFLRSELNLQRLTAAREVEDACRALATEEESLRVAEQASAERRAAAEDRAAALAELNELGRQQLLAEASAERQSAAKFLADAKAEVKRLKLQAELKENALLEAEELARQAHSPNWSGAVSLVAESELSNGLVQVVLHLQDSSAQAQGNLEAETLCDLHCQIEQAQAELVKAESEAPTKLVAPIKDNTPDKLVLEEFDGLQTQVLSLEDLCLELEQEKSHLQLQLRAARFTIRRLQNETVSPGPQHVASAIKTRCPFCEHCSFGADND